MHKVFTVLFTLSSSVAFAGETVADQARRVQTTLDQIGAAVVCTTSSRNDVSGVEQQLNSVLTSLRSKVDVSQPSLQNSAERFASLCVTVTIKK